MNRKVIYTCTFMLLAFPVMARATHIERGCYDPPTRMGVPHWVTDYMCDYSEPGKAVGGISVWMTQVDGSRVDIVTFYTSQEAADRGDENEFIATAVFQLDDFGNRHRLLLFGTADGTKKYVIGEAPAGLDL